MRKYENKGTGQQIDMLVKKYTPAQLKPVFIMSSIAASGNTPDLNLDVITTKRKAGTKLKEIIVSIINGDESDDESREDGNRRDSCLEGKYVQNVNIYKFSSHTKDSFISLKTNYSVKYTGTNVMDTSNKPTDGSG